MKLNVRKLKRTTGMTRLRQSLEYRDERVSVNLSAALMKMTGKTYTGQNFERCTIFGHFQTLSTSYTWFAPSYSETISLGVIVKSAIRAFRKHIVYIPLLVFVHHTGLQMTKNDKKLRFYTFFICSEPSCKFSSYITDINYSVNLACLGPVSLKKLRS